MENFLKLSQALNSRLCHEVSGLIGSISAGIELIESNDVKIKEQARSILNILPEELKNKIKFYRIAYGFSLLPENISIEEIKALCSNIVNNKVKIDFSHDNNLIIDSEIGKIIMCFIVSAEKNILKDGIITVAIKSLLNKYEIKIQISGALLKYEQNKIDILKGEKDGSDLDVHNSHEYYIYYLSRSLGLNISIDHDKDKIRYLIAPR